MPYTKKRAEFCRRADKIREIAQGIYDKRDRGIVLKFVKDAERVVEFAPPSVILTVFGDGNLRS